MDLRGHLENLNNALRALFALLMGVVTVWSFQVPDAVGFQRPELARIFFWHFPCPLLLTGLLFVGSYFSFRHLVRVQGFRVESETDNRERQLWDIRAVAALELGFVFCVLTMITGILFSLVQWGVWWQWDPRQTSFLLAMLVYGAYFALRTAFTDPEKRAANSAAYMLAAVLPLIFLIFVYPRLPQVEQASFHPTQSIMKGQIKGAYAQVVSAVIILTTILSVWLYRLRVRAGTLELLAEDYGQLETHGGHPAPTGVVRPVSLSDPH